MTQDTTHSGADFQAQVGGVPVPPEKGGRGWKYVVHARAVRKRAVRLRTR